MMSTRPEHNLDEVREDITAIRQLLERLVELEEEKLYCRFYG